MSDTYNLCAVRTAASSEARGKGVLVVMNEEIHAAREVVKSHSANTETFVSPFWGPLGYVDPDRVVFRRNTLGRQSIRPPELVEDVHLIKLASGSDSLLIDFLVERNVRGLVLEAFGRGNVPPAALPGIRRAVEKGIPVVITTRTIAGRVSFDLCRQEILRGDLVPVLNGWHRLPWEMTFVMTARLQDNERLSSRYKPQL